MSDVQAGIYCRISLADEGDTTKTRDQERICRQLAAQRGWTVAQVYSDESISAWDRKKRRPEWERMLADVESGKITALVVYHGDRLVRQPRDLEKLIDLAEVKGTKLASQLGDFDLATSQGRIFARIIAAFAEGESARQSERRKAQYERMRREGRVRPGGTGGRPYAFETDGVTVRDDEAELLRKAAAMILAGTPTGSVATWLNSQGTTTVTGKPFAHWSVRRLLSRARYAGLMPDGITTAAWPAIIDRGDWETICGILAARAAQHKTGPARYLLSGIATCGRCGQTLQAHRSDATAVNYACRHCFGVFRNMVLLDGYVTRMVWRRLNHPGNPQPDVPQLPGLAAEFATLTAARAELVAMLEDPAEPYVDLLKTRLKRIDERLAQLRDQTGDTARLRLIRQHHGITMEQFLGLPLPVRRALVAAHFTVVVLPASHRGPGFNPRDVRMTPI